MKTFQLVALIFTIVSFDAVAGDQGLFYVAGGTGSARTNLSFGVGTDIDVLELSTIDLGTVSGNDTAKIISLSLVQNAKPLNNFNLLFRVGFGRTTTTFSNGSATNRSGFSNGVIFGVGGQYQLYPHLAFRGELNRITYASTPDGRSHGTRFPVTISAMYIF